MLKVCLNLFTQIFTIIGTVKRQRTDTVDEESEILLPFVFALLTSKQQALYTKVIQEVLFKAIMYGINVVYPESIMTDFEKAIINSAEKVLPNIEINCCFFHLSQSVYRRVQAEDLQQRYSDPDDRQLKMSIHNMFLALAFIPM
ncbi:hypothetical protein ANN_21197 [Periplaneta americana]|uniref:MULE transposase domain-containing protein n=1 Tax=Periplaneta americana TaxID=6978 RepID=A0ABQ8SFC5_PERAM|nr:hypothetical protein ANN_21197 [Periplaneta americana]